MNFVPPKEKAKELFKKCDEMLSNLEYYPSSVETKECVRFTVKEILEAINLHKPEASEEELNYWEDVADEATHLRMYD